MEATQIITTEVDGAITERESFPMAHTTDGRLSWHHGQDGYVAASCALTGLSDNTYGRIGLHVVYLQYGEQDPEVGHELLAEMRAFNNALYSLREARRQEAHRREWEAIEANIMARKATEVAAFARARSEGQPVYLRMVGCDHSAPDCDIDVLYAMPDGSTNRVHQH